MNEWIKYKELLKKSILLKYYFQNMKNFDMCFFTKVIFLNAFINVVLLYIKKQDLVTDLITLYYNYEVILSVNATLR